MLTNLYIIISMISSGPPLSEGIESAQFGNICIVNVMFYQFISIYCLITDLMGIPPEFIKESTFSVGLLIQTCFVTLSIITTLFSAVLFLMIQIFLWGMDLWLIWKIGKNYGGRLNGLEASFEYMEEKVSFSCVVILNHNEHLAIVYKRLEEMVKNIHNSSYKLSCTIEKCLGYVYYVKNQVTSSDCCVFTKVNDKEYITRNELLEHIQKYYMINACNQKRLWYGRIFTQPVLWNKQSETKKQTVLMLTFRHCIADGPSILGVLKNFTVQGEQPELMKLDSKYTTRPTFTFDDAYVYRNPLSFTKDEPVFDLPNNERHVVFYVEDNIKYVPLVKKLKDKLGVGFTEILIAGLTANLGEVLAKRGKTMDKCTTSLALRPINENLISIINGTYNYNNLTNDVLIIQINTPVTVKESTMLDHLKSIKIEFGKAKYSIDGLASYTFSKLVHILPAPMLKYCAMRLSDITIAASNVGALKAVKIAGCEVEAAMSFIPTTNNICFTFSIFSNCDRFQLALTVKENIMQRKDAQEVVDNIFTFVDHLSEELNIK